MNEPTPQPVEREKDQKTPDPDAQKKEKPLSPDQGPQQE
jgi:hypothetical protein